MRKLILSLLFLAVLFCACEIETGYRVKMKPVVEGYNESMLAFSIFVQIDHPDKVVAEKDLVYLYHKLEDLEKQMREIAPPGEAKQRAFHQSFKSLLSFTRKLLDDYRYRFNLEITLNNWQKGYAEVTNNLRTARRNIRTALTARAKQTNQQRIAEFTAEQQKASEGLAKATEDYKMALAKLISAEEFYLNRYPEIMKEAKTSVIFSLFPPPPYLISTAEREKFFPAPEPEEVEPE